jgi:AAA domain
MLAAHPFAGKSMLVGALLKAVENGEPFLGLATVQATAVVVTEEDESALRVRAGVLELLGLQSSYVSRSSGVLDLEWPTLIERATEHALGAGHRLLVVDTFAGLAGLHGEEENDAGAITERLRPLQRAAGRGLAVLFLHHMNGYGQPRGSKAFRGVVDISVRLYRNGKDGGFRLETESRFPNSTPQTLRAKVVNGAEGWVYLSGEQRRSDELKTSDSGSGTDGRLWAALLAAGPNGITYGQFDEIDGLSTDVAKKRLPEWRKQRRVGRDRPGAKNDPYRWYPCPTGWFGAVREPLKEVKCTESL